MMVMSNITNPWDRLPEEPGMWFERFDRYYRPLGPSRTLTAAYQSHYYDVHGEEPSRPGYTDSWLDASRNWKWEERARAWDAELRKEQLEREKETYREMRKRHIDASQAVQAMALEKILDAGFKDVGTALRAWRQALTVEQSTRGIPDYVSDIHEAEDDELTEQILAELRKLGIKDPSELFDEKAEGTTADSNEGAK